jgi:PAS domain S-box-containing protein
MTEFSKIELEQKLEEAKKEIEYYKRIAEQTGNLFLRETETLSKLLRWRKQAEEALQESKELLRATIESTADGILVVNEKGQVICTNERFIQLWRIPEELIKKREDKKLLDFILDHLKEPKAFLSKVQALYKTSDEDFDVLDFKDGRVFERFSSPLIRDGQIAGRAWSFRDITDRKRAEEKHYQNFFAGESRPRRRCGRVRKDLSSSQRRWPISSGL